MMHLSEPPDMLPTSHDSLLRNTAPVEPHQHHVTGLLHSTSTTNPPVSCHLLESFGPSEGLICASSDVDGASGVHGRSGIAAHSVTTVPVYSEVHKAGQVMVTTEPTSSMRPCPSAASMLSYARSDTESSTNGPTCRICDSAGDGSNRLISPCRCSGTAKFVHEQCLNKWLETINARSAPRCEVCRYHIHTHKCYRLRNCRFPAVTACDFALHTIFVFAIVILFVSGTFTIVGFVSNHAKITSQVPRDKLSQEDVVVLVGGLTFFIAFIVALLTQIRASQSLYKLIGSCISSNTEWRIDPYRRSDDSLYHK